MSKISEAIDTIQKQTELIGKLKYELDKNRGLLARLLRSGKIRTAGGHYFPKDSIQFTFEPEKDSNMVSIKMVDFEEIKPMKSDYQRILELMEVLEL